MEPLRILHTESSMGLGGQELRVLTEAVGMSARGHEVWLAAHPRSEVCARAERRGVRVAPLALTKRRYAQLVWEFLDLIGRQAIQVVNTHGSLDSWTASVAGRLSTCRPIIVRTRHKSVPVSKSLRHRLLYGTLPHAVVTTGEAVRQALISQTGLDPSRVVSIPTGVDVGLFRPTKPDPGVRQQLGLGPSHFVIGTVAFLRDYKGLDVLLEAARIVTGACPEARFLLVGSGPEQAVLMQKVRQVGLAERVIFTGYREDIPELLAAMDAFALPSISGEGLPQALTQAMAMQVPVVATTVGSIPEVVQHRVTGMLVPPKRADALASSLLGLVQDPTLREQLGTAARRVIVETYSADAMLDQTEALYERLIRTRTPAAPRL